MRVAVCVITCHRPRELRRLLESIAAIVPPAPPGQVEIIVVDNAPDGTAAETCLALETTLPFPVRCEHEPQRGIPFARNTAVAVALAAGAERIVFVDDDETVEARWLVELLDVQARYDADVVTGPSVPHLPKSTPRWLAASGVFDLLRFPTGDRRPHAFTHNVLARASVYESVEPNFDTRLAFSGGTDTHFFRRVHAAGFSIVWADEAVAYEWIPPERARPRWVLQRAYRIGVTDAFVERDLRRRGSGRRLTALALRFVARGILTLPSAVVHGRAALLRAARDVARAGGLLAGLLGRDYEEYRPGTSSART